METIHWPLRPYSTACTPVGWRHRLRLESTASPPVSRPEVEPARSRVAGAENEENNIILTILILINSETYTYRTYTNPLACGSPRCNQCTCQSSFTPTTQYPQLQHNSNNIQINYTSSCIVKADISDWCR